MPDLSWDEMNNMLCSPKNHLNFYEIELFLQQRESNESGNVNHVWLWYLRPCLKHEKYYKSWETHGYSLRKKWNCDTLKFWVTNKLYQVARL